MHKKYQQQIKRIPVTKEGFDNLNLELDKLQKERPQAVKNLADARAMGDLSENGLYTAAKARLRSIDSQIFRLETQIKLADIVESTQKDVVGIGSTVLLLHEGQTTEYRVVGDYEANPTEKKISQHSPLGKCLMGKKVGEIAVLNAPRGEIKYKISAIS